MLRKLILIITMANALSSCALWPYKKDFDCPIPEGEGCLSLHEVMERADAGMYGTGVKKSLDNQLQKPRKLRHQKRGCCNAC